MPPKSKAKLSSKVSKKAEPAGTSYARPSPPNWPPLAPLIPRETVLLQTLLQDQILTIPNFWPSTLCSKYVAFLKTLPLVTTPGVPKKGNAVRVNDRFQIDDPAFAERLWSQTSLQTLVETALIDGETLDEQSKKDLWGGEVLGLNPNIRIYRYTKGQFFDQHYDDSNNLMFQPVGAASPVQAKTTWTLLLYLSSRATGCVGGETVFYPDPPSKREAAPAPVVAELEVGMALLHRHGRECMLHEGREVTDGEKWVIRSDLVVRR